MNSDDLDRIERELSIRLPGAYRALIQAYPVGLGSAGPDYELIDDAEQLISVNRYLRAHGFFGQPWPAHFFSFGGDGSGNEYYFDLRREPPPVCFADHEGELYTEQWPSLDAWLAERVAEEAEWQEEERRRAARKASKRWWKFWLLAGLIVLACGPPPNPQSATGRAYHLSVSPCDASAPPRPIDSCHDRRSPV